jgi:hypothetical protein
VTAPDATAPDVDGAVRLPVLTRVLGFPPAAAVFAVALGAFACSLLFDLVALVQSAPYSDFVYPSFLLQVVGVVAGIVAVTLALPDLVRLRPNARAFRSGVRQLLLCDAALVCYGVSAYLRHGRDPGADVPAGVLALSVAGAVLLAVAAVMALRFVFASVFRPVGPVSES